jgi:integrase/recombinase XerD
VLEERKTLMTPLRTKMIEDMRLAGLAPSTQRVYLLGVRGLAAHYRRSPDLLCEVEVRSYLLHLRERGVAFGTFKPLHGGIQFLFRRSTLGDAINIIC